MSIYQKRKVGNLMGIEVKCTCWLVGEILKSEPLARSVAFKLSQSPRGPLRQRSGEASLWHTHGAWGRGRGSWASCSFPPPAGSQGSVRHS